MYPKIVFICLWVKQYIFNTRCFKLGSILYLELIEKIRFQTKISPLGILEISDMMFNSTDFLVTTNLGYFELGCDSNFFADLLNRPESDPQDQFEFFYWFHF